MPQPLTNQNAATCPVEDIAQAYLGTVGGDAALALRRAISDALADLVEAERRTRETGRMISRGYLRRPAPAV